MAAKKEKKSKSQKISGKVLLEWESKAWPFIKRSSEFFRTVVVVAALIILIFILMREIITAIVVVTLVFVVYALGTIEPDKIDHKITEKGFYSGGHFYPWTELVRFWITKKTDHDMLYIETTLRFPRQVIVVLDNVDHDKLQKILNEHINQTDEPEPSFLDRSAQFLSEKIPLEG